MEQTAFSLADSLAGNPIIAAVKDPEGLGQALDSDCGVIFLLCGDICSIGTLSARAAERGKALFIHCLLYTSKLCVYRGCPYRKPTQVDRKRILRPTGEG